MPRIHIVDGVAPTPGSEQDPLPEQILSFAMDQRAFGPRQLMVAFATHAGEFLGLLWTERTDPIDTAVDVCLEHFDSLDLRRGDEGVAAVVLCDQRVVDASCRPELESMFELAKAVAERHDVHLVDWIGCDDDTFCCVRMRSFEPATEPGWWDVPGNGW